MSADDFESRAVAYDAVRNRQASVRILSVLDLEKQIGAEGATWLDRRLVMPDASDLVSAGFGLEVREAMDRRCDHHIYYYSCAFRRDVIRSLCRGNGGTKGGIHMVGIDVGLGSGVVIAERAAFPGFWTRGTAPDGLFLP